ncbi:DMT family transporter [Novosphingobium sp.]|uniref:DMT family transporter n=1 Tax=Novosphingobium sp. TaxID=1874826 RepID=UPI0025D918C9|nr:DMT family transporter [Novosphingobium sp.]MCC6926940.1 DMT family transporter [Novosphingobium sp.]
MKPSHFLLFVLICLVWASNNVLSKVLISHWHVPPLFYTALRFGIVLVCTLPWLRPLPRPVWRIAFLGVLMGGGNFALMFIALNWVSASEAAIVVQTSVPMTTLLSIVMLGERIRWRRTLGITLAFAGVLIVMYQPGFRISAGMLLLLASAFCGSLGAIMMKQMGEIRPLQFQAWVALMGVLLIGPLSLAFEPHALTHTLDAGWPALAAVFYSALVTSIFAHTAYYFLIAKYEANLVAALTLMTPLMTIGLGSWLIADPIDAKMIVGTVIALTGVLIIALRTGKGSAVVQAEEHS